jgi:hypothetical protein
MALKLWSGERVVISCWLEGGGYETSMENIERLKPLLVRARNDATRDVERARADRGPNQDAAAHTPALDFIKAFEVARGSILFGFAASAGCKSQPGIEAIRTRL